MTTEISQEAGAQAQEGAGEGSETSVENISIPKTEYEKLNQTLGSLKRELKDLKKPKEETKESLKESSKEASKSDESALLQKIERMSLRQAGITHEEDVELAQKTAKKWGMDIDEVLLDEDFKAKLERQQTNRSNVEATSNIRGGKGESQAKNTADYWQAKGTRPTPADVPDRKTRVAIIRTLMDKSKNGKKFYND